LVGKGRAELERFCAERSLPYERCGKVVVATTSAEVAALGQLERSGNLNGVEVRRMGLPQLHEREPHVRGVAASFVPAAAITDYGAVAGALADDGGSAGGEVRTGVRVDRTALAGDRGLWRLGARFWRTGVEELVRSKSHRLMLRDVQRS